MQIKVYSFGGLTPNRSKRVRNEVTFFVPGTSVTPKRGRTAHVDVLVDEYVPPPPMPPTPPSPVVLPKPKKKKLKKVATIKAAATIKTAAAAPIAATAQSTTAPITVEDLKSMMSEVMATVPAAVAAAVVPITTAATKNVPVPLTLQSTPAEGFSLDDQDTFLDMQYKNKKRDAELVIYEKNVEHQNRMTEWSMLIAATTAGPKGGRKRDADDKNSMMPKPALKAIKLESPNSKLKITSSLSLCRKWMAANGGAPMDEVLKPIQVVEQCSMLMEDPQLQEQLKFATSASMQLNYIVDAFQIEE